MTTCDSWDCDNRTDRGTCMITPHINAKGQCMSAKPSLDKIRKCQERKRLLRGLEAIEQ